MNYLLVMPKAAAKSSGGYNFFPVGIAYISASLKQNNFSVFTANLEFCEGNTFESLTELINKNRIDVICVSGLSPDYYSVKEIIDLSRQINPKIITVIGGGIISGDSEPAMKALDADIGVIGQGEITICELANALDSNQSYSNIQGLIYRNEQNEYIVTLGRTDIDDVDAIPLPDFDGFNYFAYMKSTNFAAACVTASRSCPFSCTFCFHPSGKKYRQRSLDSIFYEIDYLVKKTEFNQLIISDELFAVKKERVYEFCKRIKPYKINWSLQLRVSDVDVKMLKAMKDSGCNCVSYGLESADNSVLKSMKKRITLEQMEYALKTTYDSNIDIQGGFIFGDVAETNDTVLNTLKWHDKHPEYGIELNMIRAFPGTPIYNLACEKGIIKDKIQYLYDRCPLVNISKLTDEEYKNLSSQLYEKNMRPKYQPKIFSVRDVDSNGNGIVDMLCNKCGSKYSLDTDILHWSRTLCPQCMQRHYVDPFEKLIHSERLIESYFEKDEYVALWGAGEICIKLLNKYSFFKNDNYKVVDISKSRQGYSICGKTIFSPEIIHEEKINTIIATVVQRKDQILNQVINQFPRVKKIYLPMIEKKKEQIYLNLRQINSNGTGMYK